MLDDLSIASTSLPYQGEVTIDCSDFLASDQEAKAKGMEKEKKVLAIASHVVYGYVGNKMATFVLQAMGWDVAAINTVHFSNHTGYRQFRGTRTPASEISDLYAGLQQSGLTDFSVLLSGYAPSADAVKAIGAIARDLRTRSTNGAEASGSSFFWVLDPVMGDQGRLYVAEDIVPQYKTLVGEADLVLPNQYEAELLTGVKIATLRECGDAVRRLHTLYGVRHVIVTSVRMNEGSLTVVGSSSTSSGEARLWKVEVPLLECFFSGTGDMFAALMVARLREECEADGLLAERGWVSRDGVPAVELPLARAACKVLSSMQMVLEETMVARDAEMKRYRVPEGEDEAKRRYLAETKAAEVRVVKNWRDLLEPEKRYKAQAVVE